MDEMLKLGGKTLTGDESLVYFHRENKLIGMISIHVDDFQGTGNETFFLEIMDNLCSVFKISKRERGTFRFTGVYVKSTDDGEVIISQNLYRDSIEDVTVETNDHNERPLTKEEYKIYRGAVGKLTWLTEMSRPDLAGYVKNATVKNLRLLEKSC